MAVGWWLDTGIYFKMKKDVEALFGAQRDAWSRPSTSIRTDQPLSLTHVLPSMIIFVSATLISIIAFAVEILHKIFQRRRQEEKEWRRKASRRRVRRRMSTITPKVAWPPIII